MRWEAYHARAFVCKAGIHNLDVLFWALGSLEIVHCDLDAALLDSDVLSEGEVKLFNAELVQHTAGCLYR